MAEVHASATPTLLDGRYVLHECVGQGAMAKVYRAEDLRLKRSVAIKMMRANPSLVAVPTDARNETLLLASLNHPSLVTLLDASCSRPSRVSRDGIRRWPYTRRSTSRRTSGHAGRGTPRVRPCVGAERGAQRWNRPP